MAHDETGAAMVAFVADRGFGERLYELVKRLPVWIGSSQANRPVVEAIWARHGTTPSDREVTIINAAAEAGGEDLLLSELDTVDLHHPCWMVLEVYGVARTPRLTEALEGLGVTGFEDRADGFVASRPEPAWDEEEPAC